MPEEHHHHAEHHTHDANKKHASYGALLSIVAILIVSLVAYITFTRHKNTSQPAQQPVTTTHKLSSEPYSSSFAGFSFTPPENWIKDSAKGAVHVIYHNPDADQEGTEYNHANINVTTQVANGVSLEQFMEASKRNKQKSIPGYTEVKNQAVTVDNIPARITEATYTVNGLKLHVLQLVTIKNNNAYVITATALHSAWNKYEKIFTDSAQSLRLKPV